MSVLSKSQSMGVAAVILAVSTLLSRFMGLVRDKIISWQFGAGGESDMYFAAFVVPDIINYLLAGGFMSITLIPLLSKRFSENEADGWRFYSCVLTWMAVCAMAVTALGMLFAEPLAHVVAPGLDPSRYARLALFMRIVLPAQVFFLVGSCIIALLYLRRQFTIPALTPLIYNGCIIFFGVTLPYSGLVHGMTGYCVGVVFGAGIGTFLLPLLCARSCGFRYGPVLHHPLMKKFILLALPLMLGQTVAALDEQFLRVFGSLAGSGAVSLLNYAKRISQVPIALVGQVAAVASYPFLVSLLTKGDRTGFQETLGRALKSGMGLIVPCAMWMICLSGSVFTLIFYGGCMRTGEMSVAAPLLQIMLLATPFWIVYALLVRGFYAQTDTLTPAVVGTILTVLFLSVYYYFGAPHGAPGIAMTSAASMFFYVLALMIIWYHREGGQAFRGLFSAAVRSGLCAVPGCAGGWYLDSLVRTHLSLNPVLTSLAGLAAAGLFFLVTYLPLGARFCPDILEPMLRRVRGRLHRGK